MVIEGLVLIVLGVASLAISFFQWDWLAKSARGRAIIAIFGRKGARIFDIAAGIIVTVLGIFMLFAK